jgi:hypothetical protein
MRALGRKGGADDAADTPGSDTADAGESGEMLLEEAWEETSDDVSEPAGWLLPWRCWRWRGGRAFSAGPSAPM